MSILNDNQGFKDAEEYYGSPSSKQVPDYDHHAKTMGGWSFLLSRMKYLFDTMVSNLFTNPLLSPSNPVATIQDVANVAAAKHFAYKYRTTPFPWKNPASGEIQLNNANPVLATIITMSNYTFGGLNVAPLLSRVKAGDAIVLQDNDEVGKCYIFDVVDKNVVGLITQIQVTYSSHIGTLSDNSGICTVLLFDGSGSAFLQKMNNLSDLQSAETARNNLGIPTVMQEGLSAVKIYPPNTDFNDILNQGQFTVYTSTNAPLVGVGNRVWNVRVELSSDMWITQTAWGIFSEPIDERNTWYVRKSEDIAGTRVWGAWELLHLDPSKNFSDVPDKAAARTNLGVPAAITEQMQEGLGWVKSYPLNTDFNVIVNQGQFTVETSVNSPFPGVLQWYNVRVEVHTTDWITQTAWLFNAGDHENKRMWVRQSNLDEDIGVRVWQAWTVINLLPADNLSDVPDKAAARSNLGVSATGDVLLKSGNLAGLADPAAALGHLGALATANTGFGSGARSGAQGLGGIYAAPPSGKMVRFDLFVLSVDGNFTVSGVHYADNAVHFVVNGAHYTLTDNINTVELGIIYFMIVGGVLCFAVHPLYPNYSTTVLNYRSFYLTQP
jgi:hypothetical protein